jgi:hypothetical protein
MKSFMLGSLAAALLVSSGAALSEESCSFSIAGTWESAPSGGDPAVPARYRFGADGMVTTLSRVDSGAGPEWREAAKAARFFYRLDDAKRPSIIELLGPDGATRQGSMEISEYDAGSFTTLDANSEPTRWVRVDPEKQFIVFAATSGDIRIGGPAFVMLIRTDGEGRSRSDAFGFYTTENERIVGPIPEALQNRYMSESRMDTDTMLRIELTAAEFERSLAVLRTWERRAREHNMLYDVPYLNNVVFMEQMALSLNACGDRIRTEKFGWNVNDKITAKHNLTQLPFYYIRELRAMNDSIHLRNEEFRRRIGSACVGACRPAAPARVTQLR